jgi:hypothetical protein
MLITGLLLTCYSCIQETKTTDFSDDYVLIEFAAKLEEDYERLQPEPLDKSNN